MNELVVPVNILGAAALLLWGLRMVGTGIFRAFGAGLRRWVNQFVHTRASALLAGLAVTVALQSSTATCMMTASFVGRSLMSGSIGQTVMLGANVGTSLVTKLLTFNVGPLSAVLLLAGVALFRSTNASRRRAIARILIGLGLMLLSLKLLDAASEPLRDAPQLQKVLADLDGVWLVGLVIAAVVAMLAHSSIASILMILPLAANGAFGMPFGLALILGANLGSAIPPVMEAARNSPAERRIPLGNLLVRLIGCLLAVPWLDPLAQELAVLDTDRAAQLVDFHIAFNVVLALLFLPLSGGLSGLLAWVLPDAAAPEDARRPRHLDESALGNPSLAIGCAARESLRIADEVEAMLRRSLDLLRSNEHRLAGEIGRMDDVVDALHEAVKLYLARLSPDDLDEAESRRVAEIMTFVINLEHIGDIVDRNLKEAAERKIKHRLAFSPEGQAEITAMFEQTLENLKTAMAVFLSGEPKLARQLVAEKAEVRNLERRATEAHFGRIRDGRRESIETSALHLDILRDLKRINAHIASVAYPILEQMGELEATRLRGAP